MQDSEDGYTMDSTTNREEAFISMARAAYADGELPQWKIDRLERIPGWSWNGAKPGKMKRRAKAEDKLVRVFA